ncbi:MAG: hypothetical protein IT442_05045 [Phycisphaeraceae bacterium]|nr:hypothetical protein [Phycisphaeraceae bacterium]
MARSRRQTPSTVEQRLTTVEVSLEQIGSQLSHLVTSSERDRDELFTKIDRIKSEWSSSRQTNWPLVISCVSVLLVFSAMAGGLVMFANRAGMLPLETAMAANHARLQEVVSIEKQVPVMAEKIGNLERMLYDERGKVGGKAVSDVDK